MPTKVLLENPNPQCFKGWSVYTGLEEKTRWAKNRNIPLEGTLVLKPLFLWPAVIFGRNRKHAQMFVY